MFTPTTPPLEIVVRVVVIYVALFMLARAAGKREVGQLGPIDLLAMLVLSETVSPALTAEDTSLGAAIIAAATLLGMSAVVGRLTYWSPRFERFVDGEPVVLVRDGRVDEGAARTERITEAELAQALRKHGIDDVREVRAAIVEPNGQISVIQRSSPARSG